MNFFNDRKTVITAVNFDDNTAVLANLGAWVSRRLKKSLQVLHVLEDHQYDVAAALGKEPSLHVELRVQEFVDQTSSKDRLEKLKRAIDPRVATNTDIVLGDNTHDALAAEVKKRQAVLVVTGTNQDAAQSFPYGASTAMSLASHLPVPVMIASKRTNVAFLDDSHGPRILIADDLQKGSEETVSNALRLAIELQSSAIRHLHIFSMTDESAAPSTRQQLLSKLTARAAIYAKEIAEVGCDYQPEAVNAPDTIAAISRSAHESNSALIIYGRHKALHFKPFKIGRVPLRSLLVQNQVIVIMPANF